MKIDVRMHKPSRETMKVIGIYLMPLVAVASLWLLVATTIEHKQKTADQTLQSSIDSLRDSVNKLREDLHQTKITMNENSALVDDAVNTAVQSKNAAEKAAAEAAKSNIILRPAPDRRKRIGE